MPKIFEPKSPIRVSDLSKINIEALLKETFTVTVIQSDKTSDNVAVSVRCPTVVLHAIVFFVWLFDESMNHKYARMSLIRSNLKKSEKNFTNLF